MPEQECEHPIDEWVHELYESDRGYMNDSYYCGRCDALMQVG